MAEIGTNEIYLRINTTMVSTSRLVKFGLGMLIVAAVAEVWMVNRLTTYGEKISQLKESQLKLTLENQLLETAITEGSSMTNLSSSSAKLGFEVVKNKVYIIPDPIAAAF